MENETKELKGQLTLKEVDALKAKHGEVFSYTVDECVCYLKKPDRKILSMAMQVSKKNPMKFNESIFTNCYLGGYEGFKDFEGELFEALEAELDELLKRKSVTVKKL
jgi:hypothetical protein